MVSSLFEVTCEESFNLLIIRITISFIASSCAPPCDRKYLSIISRHIPLVTICTPQMHLAPKETSQSNSHRFNLVRYVVLQHVIIRIRPHRRTPII